MKEIKKYNFDSNLYKFGMDWLNGVLPKTDVFEVFQQLAKFSSKLRFERWKLAPQGLYNYSRRYLLDGQASIQLAYIPVSDEEYLTAKTDGTTSNPYIFFSISGDGIRKLAKMGSDVDNSALHKLLFYFYYNAFKCSRFDTYCDILDKNNKVIPLINKAFRYFQFPQVGKPTLRTNVHRTPNNIQIYNGVDKFGKLYKNCTLGNHGTRFGMFRSYNKLEELENGRLKDFASDILKDYNVKDYWYRMEYEIHKENADVCFNALMKRAVEENKLYFADIFCSALNRVFDICVFEMSTRSNNGYTDIPLWTDFFDFVLSNDIHLVQFTPPTYVVMSLDRLIKNGKRIASYIHAIDEVRKVFPDFDLYIKQIGQQSYEENIRYSELQEQLAEIRLNDLNNKLIASGLVSA